MTDNVLCPGCGEEMQIQGPFFHRKNYSGFFHCESCGWESPTGWGDTKKEAEEAARAAALRRYEPQIRPMTLEEIKEHRDQQEANPIWIEWKHSPEDNGWILSRTLNVLTIKFNNLLWRCWPRKPTEEEREAAGWEDAE